MLVRRYPVGSTGLARSFASPTVIG